MPFDQEPETHESWLQIRANTVSSNPGASLFDSEIKHQRYVIVEICYANRRREFHRDWIMDEKPILTVAMSMAQWGAFVSSFGTSGVPATLQRLGGELIEEPPYEPRMAQSTAEVKEATTKAIEDVQQAFAKVEEIFENGGGKKAMREAIFSLKCQIRNAPGNMQFAAKSLDEHVENTITKARADIEGMVTQKAAELGIEPGNMARELMP